MSKIQHLSSLVLLVCICAFQPAVAQYSLDEDFEDSTTVIGSFSAVQQQRGGIEFGVDPTNAKNRVAVFTAGPKNGGQVGKASLIHRYPQVGEGKTVTMIGRFYFPKGAKLDSLILMDLECAKCGPDTNPGIRLYLRNSTIRIDRSKIGIKEPFLPITTTKLKTDKWYKIEWVVSLSETRNGNSIVRLNGEVILDRSGITLLAQEIIKKLTNRTVISAVDRFQIGLTANSNSSEMSILVDDISFRVD
jgi:hypothetical protein